jgi:hypothetical protein
MSAASFQTFSPAYENLSNRMSRLRHNSQNHHKSYTMSASPPKPLNLFTLDTTTNIKNNRRVSPTTFNLANETITAGTGKFTGRVTKNVGLKKYNQRQIKEVMNNRENVHVRHESNYGAVRVYTENDTPRDSTGLTGLGKWPLAGITTIDEVKMS